jgi:hypothetical protein
MGEGSLKAKFECRKRPGRPEGIFLKIHGKFKGLYVKALYFFAFWGGFERF